jgi:hypothetical protein
MSHKKMYVAATPELRRTEEPSSINFLGYALHYARSATSLSAVLYLTCTGTELKNH